MAAALSLQCKDCGAQLRSVAECQSHGEATGEHVITCASIKSS